ncbi:hypothetical protein VHUM_01961 [Vanrija humicola]|uniref:Alcohol dehydrogenase-like N-terminal domain-containing protein n=1 Tax=Vanrija humicola TaxID=5417 RepID=A0A7D8V167_VANHU|nr:hypothetical protein VHUM_01961 [Vanrija humicola]
MTVGPSAVEQRFDPSKVQWTLLKEGDPALADKKRNIFCAYNHTGDMHMLEKDVPEPKAGEVLLHVRATGICGSDIHFWKHGRIGDTELQDECGAGHESAGEIIALGEGVEGWKVGDRVAIEAGIPCGQASCRFCLEGRYNQCRNMVFHSSPPFHGTLTRFIAHPAAWIHKLPDNVSFEEGSMVEPLSVALAGLEAVNVKLADTVLICGAGPIGLMSLLSAHAAGCYPIVITDLVENRLEFAKKLVPTVRTFLIERDAEPKATGEKIQELAATPLKVAIECTGFESSITTAIYVSNGQSPTHSPCSRLIRMVG